MDTLVRCMRHSIDNLYHNSDSIKNNNLVYLINTIHLLGVLAIQLGIFLPIGYMRYYVYYLMVLFLSYFYFDNNCFMSQLSNYYSGKEIEVLCIKFSDAKLLLLLHLFLGVLFVIIPSIAPYTIISKLIGRF